MTLALRELHQVAVHSSDLDRSIAFYRDRLGAELIAKFEPPGLAFFRFGTTRLLLERNAARRDALLPRRRRREGRGGAPRARRRDRLRAVA